MLSDLIEDKLEDVELILELESEDEELLMRLVDEEEDDEIDERSEYGRYLSNSSILLETGSS